MASWKKGDLTQLSGAANAQGRPSAYVGKGNVPRVVYRGADNHVHEMRLEGGSWKGADLTQSAGAPPAADHPFGYETPFDGNTPRVIYRSQDGHIQEIRLDGGTWKKADLTDLAGAPPAQGVPHAAATNVGGHDDARMVYCSNDGHIWEVRLEGGSWKKGDLTALSGAAPAAGNPFIYLTGHTVRVIFLGNDHHIHELHLDAGSTWKKDDLSAVTQAPNAAGDPIAAAPNGEPRVIHRGTDGHVWELRLEGGSWKKGDLTVLSGAEGAQGRPFVYATGSDPRVIFRGAGSEIVELRLEGGSWKKGNLTELSGGAAPAAGDPIAYVTPDGPTPRVLYRSGDGHIHELRLDQSLF